MERIGLFGGTFNPIHLGHLRAALEVKGRFRLDKLFLIPSALPPHKEPRGLAQAQDRLEMIRLSTAGIAGLVPSDIELDRPGLSYSIDTIQHFRAMQSAETRSYLVVGTDAFLDIDTWKSYRDIFTGIDIIVMDRPGIPPLDVAQGGLRSSPSGQLAHYIHSCISAEYRYSPSLGGYRHPELHAIYPCAVTALDISSTRIRRLVREDRAIRFLVPEVVETYINAKGLYR